MVNQYITLRSPMNRFVTLWVGVFSSDGMVRFVDAGHGHWLIAGADGPRAPEHRGGIPLGIDEAFAYESERLELLDDERVVLFTDGAVEQVNGEGEQYGLDRVVDVLRGTDSPGRDVDALMSALDAWRGAGRLDDDVTIASLQGAG